jgi:hypothetical protein
MYRLFGPAVAGLLLVATAGLSGSKIASAGVSALYARPAAPPAGPLRVFHLGHSLVGRDMPAMLAQLAGVGHAYESQLGWGTTMKAHWEPGHEIMGFDRENDHPHYRPAREAVSSGQYDALVLTEMVEIKDAVRYFNSAAYLKNWAEAAWAANPQTRIYLYETWHPLDDAEGWLARLDRDIDLYWEGRILVPALRDRPIYVIPAGQVLAAFVRQIEARGGVGNVANRQALFSDAIHFNDLGAYLVALTHLAVLYQRDPRGLAHQLLRADGSPADAPDAEAARLMQEVVWEVVSTYPKAGIVSQDEGALQ